MRKKLLGAAVVIIFAVVFISVIKDQAIKSAITAQAASVVGAPVEIKHFSLGLTRQTVRKRF